LEAIVSGFLTNTMRVTIVDFGIGNLWSVQSALRFLGYDSVVSTLPLEVEQADALILPGVGSFHRAMMALHKSNLDEAILEAVKGRGRKILGICLGMQLLADSSTEDGDTQGLCLISANARRFDIQAKGQKVPHIGFNQVRSSSRSILFKDIGSGADFYFVHSYHLPLEGLSGHHGICHYGRDFLAAYENENIFATQFHPEKSQTNGLRLLKNFLEC